MYKLSDFQNTDQPFFRVHLWHDLIIIWKLSQAKFRHFWGPKWSALKWTAPKWTALKWTDLNNGRSVKNERYWAKLIHSAIKTIYYINWWTAQFHPKGPSSFDFRRFSDFKLRTVHFQSYGRSTLSPFDGPLWAFQTVHFRRPPTFRLLVRPV